MKLDPRRLALAQARACITSKEIQKRSGISTVSLTRIRHGQQEPHPQTIGRLAKALGIPVEDLIEKEE